jgi:hypothetical protein
LIIQGERYFFHIARKVQKADRHILTGYELKGNWPFTVTGLKFSHKVDFNEQCLVNFLLTE